MANWLITPGFCTIRVLDRSLTPVDGLAGEGTVESVYKTAFELKGQLDYLTERERRYRQEGGNPSTVAVLTVMIKDATAQSWRPDSGDRLVKYVDRDGNEIASNLYVVKMRPTAPWRRGYLQWLIDLETRGPARYAENE